VLAPLVEDGVRVVGIDRSASMLAAARAKLARLTPRVRARASLVRADIRWFGTARRFPLVIAPFNTLLHLYHPDALLRCLACVRAALSARGRFVFDVVNPDPHLLARDGRIRWMVARLRAPDGRLVRYGVERRYDRTRQIAFMRIHYQPLDGGRRRVVRLAHRMYFPQEIEAWLRLGGFRLVERWGDFSRGRLDDRAAIHVCVAAPDGK
jgi:SAM-dependent methyltransferase